jgi:rhodanese-related sulfurtransferase
MGDITVDDAAAIIDQGALLLDVRELDEWEAGHVAGASFIAMGSVAERLAELPTDRPIVVMCRSGARSTAVTNGLLGMGYDAVNLAGGIQAWAASDRPVVTDSGTPGTVI